MLQLVPLIALALVTGYAPAAGGLNCDGECAVTASGLPPGPTLAACGYGWDLGQRLQVPGYGAVTAVIASPAGNMRPGRACHPMPWICGLRPPPRPMPGACGACR